MTTPSIPGIHHITAIAGDPQRNLDFYTTVLGLRLVKLTVKFDPGTYHFYFGNQKGSPGSILTFFPWSKDFVWQSRLSDSLVPDISEARWPDWRFHAGMPW